MFDYLECELNLFQTGESLPSSLIGAVLGLSLLIPSLVRVVQLTQPFGLSVFFCFVKDKVSMVWVGLELTSGPPSTI